MTDLNLSYDYCTGWGNPNEAFFWIAVMQNPYMSEPHCYGASISFQSEDALLLIERMKYYARSFKKSYNLNRPKLNEY